MATDNKDFKVKNGLVVANGGTFGGTVSVATPTLEDHATTKAYVDGLISSGSSVIPVGSQPPLNPENGQLWYNSDFNRINVFYNGSWYAMPNLEDVPEHTHEDGAIYKTVDAGFYNDSFTIADAGFYNTNTWNSLWDSGEVLV